MKLNKLMPLAILTALALQLSAQDYAFDHKKLAVKAVKGKEITAALEKSAVLRLKEGGWATASAERAKKTTVKNEKGVKTTVSVSNKFYTVEHVYQTYNGCPAVFVDLTLIPKTDLDSLSGSIPSLDTAANLVMLTLPGREPLELVVKKHKQYQLRTWAVLSDKDPAKPAVMYIIPSLDLYDFSSGGNIAVGGFSRGYGWRPGMEIHHPDFIRSKIEKGQKYQSRYITVPTTGNADHAKVYQDVMKVYRANFGE